MNEPIAGQNQERRLLRPMVVVALVVLCSLSGCSTPVGEGDREWNDLVKPFRHDLEMNGCSMHYIDMGNGQPVLLVHGYADSTFSWHRNLRALVEAGFRVVLADQPGLGRSGVPPEPYRFSVENQAGQILELADRLGLTQFALAGHSMGGGIALYISLHHPDRVSRTVVVDPACYNPGGHGKSQLLSIPGVAAIVSAFDTRWMVEGSLEEVYFDHELLTEALIDEYARPMARKGYLEALGNLQRQYFSEAHARMTESYQRLEPPLLILWGDNDAWVPPDFGARLHRETPDSRYHLVSNAGHNPHQEKPDEVNAVILEFLREDREPALGPPGAGRRASKPSARE